jgi:hypothetical protein
MVRTVPSGLLLGHVEELTEEPLVEKGDDIEDGIDRRARNVALLISAGVMGAVILIALLLQLLTI